MISRNHYVLCGLSLLFLLASSSADAVSPANPCNPCAPKAQNPCAVGQQVDPKLVTRPAGTYLATGDRVALVKEGEALWKSTKLSTNGLSCASCHQNNAAFNASFAKPYPHAVAMAEAKSGLKQIHLDEMVQFCMVVPLAAKPLPWDSKELAALTAYAEEVQKTFTPAAAKPAMPTNPCNPAGQ